MESRGVKMKITKIKKTIGLSLLFLFGLLMWDLWILPKKSDLFFELWAKDVQYLQRDKKLPTQFEDIGSILVQPLNQEARDLMDQGRPPFNENPKGNLKLEILLDVWQSEEDKQEGVYIQYDLIAEDGNTMWELSRTILLPESSSLILSWFPKFFKEFTE